MPRFRKCSECWMHKSQHNLILFLQSSVVGRHTDKLQEKALHENYQSFRGIVRLHKRDTKKKVEDWNGLEMGRQKGNRIPKRSHELGSKTEATVAPTPTTIIEVSSHQVFSRQAGQAKLLYYFQGLYRVAPELYSLLSD